MEKIPVGESRAGGYILIAFLFLLWECLARWGVVDPNFLPPPGAVARSLLGLVESGEILGCALVTLRRVIPGCLVGASCGCLLGFLCGYSSRLRAILGPTLEWMRPMPSVALIPVGIMILGMGDRLEVAVIGWACSWPVYINTLAGVRSTDRMMLDTARTFGFGGSAVVFKVVVPFALPFVATGLRVSLGIAMAVAVITEMAACGDGLGYFILSASLSCRTPEMYAGIVAVGALGYFLNAMFLLAEGRVLAWRQGFSGDGK
jgi:NitT/TauT family transport system permease protein